MLEILIFVGLCLTFGVFRVMGCLFSLAMAVVVAVIVLLAVSNGA